MGDCSNLRKTVDPNGEIFLQYVNPKLQALSNCRSRLQEWVVRPRV
jgi:hypothetical protein